MNQPKGFLASLFDFSFSTFIATRIVGVLYGIGIAIAASVAFVIFSMSLSRGAGSGIVGLVGAIIIFFLYVLAIRIGLESLISALKTAENTGKILEIMQRENRSL
jgi:threonine/homoserine/homoserine lactone efflux protein